MVKVKIHRLDPPPIKNPGYASAAVSIRVSDGKRLIGYLTRSLPGM